MHGTEIEFDSVTVAGIPLMPYSYGGPCRLRWHFLRHRKDVLPSPSIVQSLTLWDCNQGTAAVAVPPKVFAAMAKAMAPDSSY